MIERATTIWDVSTDDVDLVDGAFQHKSDSDLKMPFKELSAKLNGTGGPISSQVSVDPQGVGAAFATHIVDLEVDPDTGKVTILRYTAVQDAGKAVHPSYVEGQMQGGVVQGIGWALNEEYFFNQEGGMDNSSFLDYRMPTSLDLPMIDTVIVEVANPGHPFGVRGVGEVPIVPPMAAIANAIYDAVGVRLTRLPMSPGAVLQALWVKEGGMDNSSFLDYRMPTSLDLPMIDTVIVEVANPGHPFGVRGVGEVPIVPPMAAIANAIYDAVGVRLTRLPMSPGAVLQALWVKDK